jgi:thiamine transport system substrate-binding protein
MFVYPVRREVALPEAFVEFAVTPTAPLQLPAEQVDANRDRWVARWTDIVVR